MKIYPSNMNHLRFTKPTNQEIQEQYYFPCSITVLNQSLSTAEVFYYDGEGNEFPQGRFNIPSDYLFQKALLRSDTAPTIKGLYPLIETGIYTNLGGIDAPIGKLNFASFDGTTWKLIAVEISNDAVDNLTSSSTTSKLSANMGRVLDEKISDNTGKFNDLLNPTSNLITDYPTTEKTAAGTNSQTLTSGNLLKANQKYIINIVSTDNLSSGLELYIGGIPTSIKFFPAGTNFAAGVSFEYTPTANGDIDWRSRIIGAKATFTITHNKYTSSVLDGITTETIKIQKSIFAENIYSLSNYYVNITTNFEQWYVQHLVGKTLTIKFKAPYTGRFTIYAKKADSSTYALQDVTSADFSSEKTYTITIPSDCKYLTFRTYQIVTIDSLNIEYPKIYKESVNLSNWKGKIGAFYGDSITASGNGNFDFPFSKLSDQNWVTIVGSKLELSKVYGRGIGGQKYAFGTNGGSVAFINADGTFNNRNDSFNYDNYTGSIPAGAVKTRGAYSSWHRIITMFPASIKDTIDFVIVKGATNDAIDATNVAWVSGSTTDTEWAASTQYAAYGSGDYNLNTLKGGLASTIMKLQAWMPNALIIIATPLSGRGTAGQLNMATPITDEYTKSIYVREVANIFSLPIIDINAKCGINGLNRTTFISDAVHPYLTAGKNMLARTVIGEMMAIYPMIKF